MVDESPIAELRRARTRAQREANAAEEEHAQRFKDHIEQHPYRSCAHFITLHGTECECTQCAPAVIAKLRSQVYVGRHFLEMIARIDRSLAAIAQTAIDLIDGLEKR